MKRLISICLLLALIVTAQAQKLNVGLKGGVLGNKAQINGLNSQFKEENQTGFQVGPMLQYQTGFYGLTFDFSLLYAQRGAKVTHTGTHQTAHIKTQSIDIPIELKWELGISEAFDMFVGIGPSFSFLLDKDNWGRKLAHIAVDVVDKDLSSMSWRSTEMGLNLGGGIKLMQHLMVSCYYNIGLTQSAKYHVGGGKHEIIDMIFDGDIFESKNRYWQLSVAYLF